MIDGDPTDQALATIASILDGLGPTREPEKAPKTEIPDPVGIVAGYSKTGPGPLEAIRFRWTVRQAADGQYFVDETIGDRAQAITSGPMTADAAVRFVDDQASEARQRFEALRNEMAGRAAAADILRSSDT